MSTAVVVVVVDVAIVVAGNRGKLHKNVTMSYIRKRLPSMYGTNYPASPVAESAGPGQPPAISAILQFHGLGIRRSWACSAQL